MTASVPTPVTIPLRYPLNTVVLPAPGTITSDNATVTPYPIVAPAAPGSVVVIPMVWSAASSIKQTLAELAQLPGFLADQVKSTAVVKFSL